MIVPIITLNGSNKDVLLRQNQKARDALTKAITALADAEPHGRDYPPGADRNSEYTLARKEHESRLDRLTTVCSELNALIEYIYDQK